MIDKGIAHARAQILDNEVIIKAVNLGADPELNVFIGDDLETLTQGWRHIDDIRMQILKFVDKARYDIERRSQLFPGLSSSIACQSNPQTQPSRSQEPIPGTGQIVKRDTPQTGPKLQTTLGNLMDEINPEVKPFVNYDNVSLTSIQGVLNGSGIQFLEDLHRYFDRIRKGGIMKGRGYQQGNRTLVCTYDGVLYSDVEPFLKNINGLPSNQNIKHFGVEIDIQVDQDQQSGTWFFRRFMVRFSKA